jgi:hypothetical protein
MEKIEVQMLYKLTKIFMDIQKNMLNPIAILLFNKVLG